MKDTRFKLHDWLQELIWGDLNNRYDFLKFLGVEQSTCIKYFEKHNQLLTCKNVKDFIAARYAPQAAALGYSLISDDDFFVLVEKTQIAA